MVAIVIRANKKSFRVVDLMSLEFSFDYLIDIDSRRRIADIVGVSGVLQISDRALKRHAAYQKRASGDLDEVKPPGFNPAKNCPVADSRDASRLIRCQHKNAISTASTPQMNGRLGPADHQDLFKLQRDFPFALSHQAAFRAVLLQKPALE